MKYITTKYLQILARIAWFVIMISCLTETVYHYTWSNSYTPKKKKKNQHLLKKRRYLKSFIAKGKDRLACILSTYNEHYWWPDDARSMGPAEITASANYPADMQNAFVCPASLYCPIHPKNVVLKFYGLVQDCSISIANGLEIGLLQSCTKPSKWLFSYRNRYPDGKGVKWTIILHNLSTSVIEFPTSVNWFTDIGKLYPDIGKSSYFPISVNDRYIYRFSIGFSVPVIPAFEMIFRHRLSPDV